MTSKTNPRHGTCPTCGQHTKLSQPATFNASQLMSHIEHGKPICQHGEDLTLITSTGMPRCALCRHGLTPAPLPVNPSTYQEPQLWL